MDTSRYGSCLSLEYLDGLAASFPASYHPNVVGRVSTALAKQANPEKERCAGTKWTENVILDPLL